MTDAETIAQQTALINELRNQLMIANDRIRQLEDQRAQEPLHDQVRVIKT